MRVLAPVVGPTDLKIIREKIDSLTDLVLSEKPIGEIKEDFQRTLEFIRDLKSPNAQSAIERSLVNLVEAPQEILAQIDYTLPHANLELVVFEEAALKDFVPLNLEISRKLVRALLKGFVPPKSGSGVVRITDVHKNLVEVKAIPSIYRFLGCIEGNRIRVRKLYIKRNEGAGGSLATFSSLCK